jgi:hypothetical protein
VRRRTFLLALLAGYLPFTAQADEAKRVWVIGDSNGFLLMRHLKRLGRLDEVVVEGNPVGGASILWWSSAENRPKFWPIRSFHPDLVLVVLGTNDAHLGDRVIRHLPPYLDRLLGRLKGTKADILWVGPPKMPSERTQRGAQTVLEMVVNRGVSVLDSRECPMTMWEDRIHPDEKGQELWASWIWDQIGGSWLASHS